MRDKMAVSAISPLATGLTAEQLSAIKAEEHEQRKVYVLWRRPVLTLKYCLLEAWHLILLHGSRMLDRHIIVPLIALVTLYNMPGPHRAYMEMGVGHLQFAIYWLGLGVLSSVGFGTGLHTFLLYLGPHIVAVTVAAYECQSLKFPAPPYPDVKTCPLEPYNRETITVWAILYKVHWEALLWGVGTAFGELPPYFMARAARLSGGSFDAEDQLERRAGTLNMLDRSKLCMESLVHRVGFFGILACASIPNPLFDLAGIACGHFQVPFWKFFIATLIGKAFIKSYLQQLCVVVAFNDQQVSSLVTFLGRLPLLGKRLQTPLKNLLTSTKQRMHHKSDTSQQSGILLVTKALELCAFVMVAFLVISIINMLAQRHYKRLQKQQRAQRTTQLEAEAGQELQLENGENKVEADLKAEEEEELTADIEAKLAPTCI